MEEWPVVRSYGDWEADYPDIPEVCPICHEPNSNDDGSPIFDGAFCSPGCAQVYGENQREFYDGLAEATIAKSMKP